jgi:hypothetical protein
VPIQDYFRFVFKLPDGRVDVTATARGITFPYLPPRMQLSESFGATEWGLEESAAPAGARPGLGVYRFVFASVDTGVRWTSAQRRSR